MVSKTGPLKIYMEACGGSHEWGRLLTTMGHKIKLIAPHFVNPFRQGDKNDWNDALAIGVAGAQPTMRYVAIKSVDQQTIQSLQRDRVAVANQLRGLQAEFDVVLPKSIATLRNRVPEILDSDKFIGVQAELFQGLLEELKQQDDKVKQYTKWIKQLAKVDPVAVSLMKLNGIGVLTASALSAEVADARVFRNGRQLLAYLSLVPRQFSAGGKNRLGSITKRGDRYIRQLLVHGARSVIRHLGDKQDRTSCWIRRYVARRGMNKAVVALANKQTRWAWAVMAQAQT